MELRGEEELQSGAAEEVAFNINCLGKYISLIGLVVLGATTNGFDREFVSEDSGEIEYPSILKHLKERYQSVTKADICRLRSTVYNQSFMSVEAGVQVCLYWPDCS